MAELTGDADLAGEPFGAEHGGELGTEDLDGDRAIVFQVVGKVDSGHAAVAEFALEAVAAGQGSREVRSDISQAMSVIGRLLLERELDAQPELAASSIEIGGRRPGGVVKSAGGPQLLRQREDAVAVPPSLLRP